MGLDICIKARIREKATGRIISLSDALEYEDEEGKGFFMVCCWGRRIFSDVRDGMINICNKHLNADYNSSDFVIPVPQSALRKIYHYLLKRSYSNDNDWLNRISYENCNLRNADKLHSLLAELELIKYENDTFDYRKFILNDTFDYRKFIPDEKDLEDFEKSPQSYGWEFRIFNSY